MPSGYNKDGSKNKGQFKKGQKVWNSGVTGYKQPKSQGKNHWKYRGEKPNCPMCGKKLASFRPKLCKSCSKKGDKNPYYKWGVSTEIELIRHSRDAKNWTQKVYARDDFTCQRCRKRGEVLRAHHDKPWNSHPELRFELNNGVTLCELCHKEVHRVLGY